MPGSGTNQYKIYNDVYGDFSSYRAGIRVISLPNSIWNSYVFSTEEGNDVFSSGKMVIPDASINH